MTLIYKLLVNSFCIDIRITSKETKTIIKDYGTLAYRDTWNLFDQILLSNPLADKKIDG